MDSKKTNERGWKSPLPARIQARTGSKNLVQAVEIAASDLIARFNSTTRPSGRPAGTDHGYVPIEQLANYLGISESFQASPRGSSGLLRVGRNGTRTVDYARGEHYYRQRFTLAHEVGHVALRYSVGSLSDDELDLVEQNQREEEALCDLFASALLMPLESVTRYLEDFGQDPGAALLRIGREFRVSLPSAIRRISTILDAPAVFWTLMQNPRSQESRRELRVNGVFPTVAGLTRWYVPLYCTAKDSRFRPNLVREAWTERRSVVGRSEVAGLGSVPLGRYKISCAYFGARHYSRIGDPREGWSTFQSPLVAFLQEEPS